MWFSSNLHSAKKPRMGDCLQPGKVIYWEGLKRAQMLETRRAGILPHGWEREICPPRSSRWRLSYMAVSRTIQSLRSEQQMKRLAFLRRTVVYVALTSCRAQRHRERWDKVGGGPHVKRDARAFLERGQKLATRPEAQGRLRGIFFLLLLHQELERALREPRKAEWSEQQGNDSALKGPERTMGENDEPADPRTHRATCYTSNPWCWNFTSIRTIFYFRLQKNFSPK